MDATVPAETIKAMVAEIDSQKTIGEARRAEILDTLETYECWAPFFRLLGRRLADKQKRSLQDYVRAAAVQSRLLEDVFAATATCSALVEDLEIDYKTFYSDVLPRIVDLNDWNTEAAILQGVSGKFKSPKDEVAVLERLCFLFEKKVHNEDKLAESYEKLLAADQSNIKALRYFKLAFTHSHQWEEVAAILAALLKAQLRPQEVFRAGQELAAVLLYQLDRPQDAIRVLEDYCTESPLDTSTIHFDAYMKLGDLPGCIRVLRQCLLNVDDNGSRAVLHYRIGNLYSQLGDKTAAEDNFEKSTNLSENIIQPVESLVSIKLEHLDWTAVRKWMGELQKRIHDEALRNQIEDALKRLDDGIAARA